MNNDITFKCGVSTKNYSHQSRDPEPRGLRGEKLREAVTSGDQLTQSPICPCSGPGPRQAVTGDQYNTVQSITARHHVGNVCKLKRTLDQPRCPCPPPVTAGQPMTI